MLLPWSEEGGVLSSMGHEYLRGVARSLSETMTVVLGGFMLVIRYRLFRLAVVLSISASSSSFIGFSSSF